MIVINKNENYIFTIGKTKYRIGISGYGRNWCFFVDNRVTNCSFFKNLKVDWIKEAREFDPLCVLNFGYQRIYFNSKQKVIDFLYLLDKKYNYDRAKFVNLSLYKLR